MLVHDGHDEFSVDDHLVLIQQFGLDSAPPLGPAGLPVNQANVGGHNGTADGPDRGFCTQMLDVGRPVQPYGEAGPSGGESLGDESIDDHGLPFGSTTTVSSYNALAAFTMAISSSSCRILLRAEARSPAAGLGVATFMPASTGAWCFHR